LVTVSNEEMCIPMTATLRDMLFAPDNQPKVKADCFALIDQQVAGMSGISGTAVKLAHKAVTSFAPGYYQDIVTAIVPLLVDKLEPYWADFNTSGGSEFGDYLAKRGDEVSEALLSVTDAVAERSERPAILKAYRTVRGGAGRHIQAALPQVGDLVMKYAT
jgi:hypothetical protein